MVNWELLSPDDANGEITEYRVCYKQISFSGNLCESFTTVVGKNVRSQTLSGLKKYTSYEVAVQASTAIGFGPAGTSAVAQTFEDSKYYLHKK